VLLVGVAGSGKSQFAKYVGKQTNQLVINLDLAKMKGKYVGDTEKMTRESIETIDTIKNCVVLVDEIEKGLAGVSGAGDSGSSANQGATFLKWLSDKEEGGSYIIATANNIEQLPSEYKRAERWDGIFFLDLPTEEIRKGIIQFYVNYYKLDVKKSKLDDLLTLTKNWTGAEIKTMCRLASALEKSCIEIATEYVTTIYSVDKEKIDSLREWSVGRTISCDYKQEAKQPKSEKVKKLGSIKLNKGEFPNEAI
jgi:SpoVK/Ycf46/Vps4 family AAA+-type ATPase